MKKSLALILVLVLVVSAFGLVLSGCGSSKDPIVVWVGTESVEFYQQKVDEYIAKYNESGKTFPYQILVQGVDTESAATKFLDDTEAGADIFTVAHDNLGKLTAGSSGIAPITDEGLLAQINNENPDAFLSVIKAKVSGKEYTFGVPYISQALVLYYNTDFLNEEDVKSWEGIWAKAKDANKKSLSIKDTSGYNNSFLVLATEEGTGKTSVKIYQNGSLEDCYFQGDDTVAVMQWGQRFFTDANGGTMPSSSGWEVELKNETSLAFIGGAWHFKAAKASLGSKLGVAILPTFTLTEKDVSGTNVTAGTVYRSGTFADCKVFVMKKGSKKAEYLQDIIKYLSSKSVQEQSFELCQNLPSYKNASNEFASMKADTLEAKLAQKQVEMFQYGIAQPFGASTSHNFYYYSKGGPEILKEILENKDGLYNTTQSIRDKLAVIENIWKTGKQS